MAEGALQPPSRDAAQASLRWIQAQMRSIRNHDLLCPPTFAGLDLDGILETRESPPFDAAWSASFQEVERAWVTTAAGKRAVAALRKAAFLAASRATCQHEMAGHVSDDFALMGKAMLLGVDDSFLAGLRAVYASGTVPGHPFPA